LAVTLTQPKMALTLKREAKYISSIQGRINSRRDPWTANGRLDRAHDLWATSDFKTILVAGGTAFLAPLIVRAAGEGSFDTNRASKGDVRSGDVEALPTAATPVLAETPGR
jgi:hypothetical protein